MGRARFDEGTRAVHTFSFLFNGFALFLACSLTNEMDRVAMLSMKTVSVAVVVFSLFAGTTATNAAGPASPLSPAEAQKLFQLPPELKIEIVAAEPEVIDPIAIRFDEAGRIWVAEMRDYPTGPPAGGDQHSRIRVLEDRDGDGRFETSTT